MKEIGDENIEKPFLLKFIVDCTIIQRKGSLLTGSGVALSQPLKFPLLDFCQNYLSARNYAKEIAI
jgi:hypothetical protein